LLERKRDLSYGSPPNPKTRRLDNKKEEEETVNGHPNKSAILTEVEIWSLVAVS
jgi:hypothetical protein